MTTAQDIISDSLSEARVYAPGETVSAADFALCLRLLNRMMDSWSNETLACFATLTQSGVLVPGVATYNVGPASSFQAVRPLDFADGPGAAYLQDNLGNNYPVDIVPQDVWNQIGNRTTTSQIPDTLFIDPQFPVAIFNLFPTPTIAYTLFWVARLQLQGFPNLTTVVSLPPGYEDALVHNLTIRLKPHFKAAQIDPVIIELASQTKAAVKRTNIKAVEASYDGVIVSKASGTYNIYRDGRGSGT